MGLWQPRFSYAGCLSFYVYGRHGQLPGPALFTRTRNPSQTKPHTDNRLGENRIKAFGGPVKMAIRESAFNVTLPKEGY